MVRVAVLDKLERTNIVNKRQHVLRVLTKTYTVIRIDSRYPPASICTFLANAEPLPLFPRIVYIPAIDVSLGFLRLIGEGVKFLNPTQLACPCLYAVIYVPSLLVVREAEANEREIPTT